MRSWFSLAERVLYQERRLRNAVEEGFTEGEIRVIMGGNVVRLLLGVL